MKTIYLVQWVIDRQSLVHLKALDCMGTVWALPLQMQSTFWLDHKTCRICWVSPYASSAHLKGFRISPVKDNLTQRTCSSPSHLAFEISLKIKQIWTRTLSYRHSCMEARRRKTCSISNNNTTDILIWLRRHSHLLDAVSGGVRSQMVRSVGCACAVWVTQGRDRVRLHTVSIPTRRQTLWTSGSGLLLRIYTCPTAVENGRRRHASVFPGSLYQLLEMCCWSIYTPCIQQTVIWESRDTKWLSSRAVV